MIFFPTEIMAFCNAILGSKGPEVSTNYIGLITITILNFMITIEISLFHTGIQATNEPRKLWPNYLKINKRKYKI